MAILTGIEELTDEGQGRDAQNNPHLIKQILTEIKAETRQAKIEIMQVKGWE